MISDIIKCWPKPTCCDKNITIITNEKNIKIYEIDLFLYDIVKYYDQRILIKILIDIKNKEKLLSFTLLNSENAETMHKIQENVKDNIDYSTLKYTNIDFKKQNYYEMP